MFSFFHTYSPDPIVFTIGSFGIHWYGLLLGCSAILGYVLVSKLAPRFALSAEQATDVYVSLFVGGLVGARIYHVLLALPEYAAHPASIIAIWEGGLAIHGGVIGGAAVLWYYARKYHTSFVTYADLFVLPLLLGQAIGRWGNYFNQELFGAPTARAWGIFIDQAHRPLSYIEYRFFHPTFLYESLWNIVSFGILLLILRARKRQPGTLLWAYVALYSVGRFAMEFIRIDTPPVVFGVRFPMLLSGVLFLCAMGMILKTLTANHKQK